jgi:hypothetical protein
MPDFTAARDRNSATNGFALILKATKEDNPSRPANITERFRGPAFVVNENFAPAIEDNLKAALSEAGIRNGHYHISRENARGSTQGTYTVYMRDIRDADQLTGYIKDQEERITNAIAAVAR